MRTVVRILLALACALASLTLVTPADAAYRYTAPRTLRAAAATTSTLSLRWTAPRGAKAPADRPTCASPGSTSSA